MNQKRREAVAQSFVGVDAPALDCCNCLPLSSLQALPSQKPVEDVEDSEKITPASKELRVCIRSQLEHFFPRSTPLSLLLLHISQLEHIHIAPQSPVPHRRQRYHAPEGFLEQILVNVRRAIRQSDQLLVDEGVGAAIIFPEVDQHGIHMIVERIYRSVSLLQAETVIPPLKLETAIALGVGTYSGAGTSIEHFLYQVSSTSKRFTLRPAITTQLWSVKPMSAEIEEIAISPLQDSQETMKRSVVSSTIPYMQLPTRLPTRLKHLIPYHIARELRCAPVGRDHHCLTVAMADPANRSAIHRISELTGLTIFPVACELAALDALLTHNW